MPGTNVANETGTSRNRLIVQACQPLIESDRGNWPPHFFDNDHLDLADGSRRRQLLSAQYVRLRSTLRWSDWTEAAADEFGRQKAHLETAGTLIEDMDIAIGSLAISLDAMLATYDGRHMSHLNGLVIDDWSH